MSASMPTAKVYQFPARPRQTVAAQGGPAQIVELRPAPAGIVFCPAVSYHEAAIAEAAHGRKG